MGRLVSYGRSPRKRRSCDGRSDKRKTATRAVIAARGVNDYSNFRSNKLLVRREEVLRRHDAGRIYDL